MRMLVDGRSPNTDLTEIVPRSDSAGRPSLYPSRLSYAFIVRQGCGLDPIRRRLLRGLRLEEDALVSHVGDLAARLFT